MGQLEFSFPFDLSEMNNEFDEIRDSFYEYWQQGKIAFFVGAGVSALSGLSSWSDLVLDMADKIGYRIKLYDKDGKKCLSSDEYLKIPQVFFDSRTERDYISFVRKVLNKKREPNNIHKMIMRLRPDHILTTNYDTLIEQTANMTGMSYSVINADSKVASVPTQHFILKVHGDFESNNFVLKESDYLNYETNFKLIDTIVKTIISTHMVVFIGYGLGDYNIKLILNWVKQVQEDSFIEPVFIYTGYNELSDMELSYYRGEHLKVIDVNKLLKNPDVASYLERYSIALESLIDPDREKKWFRNETWIVDHFYKITEPLHDVNYLRMDDIAGMFPGARLYLTNQLKCDDFAYLLNAYTKKEKLSKKRKEQLNLITQRLYNSGVEVIRDFYGDVGEEINAKIRRGLAINNDTFDFSYQIVRERINSYGNDLDSQYRKAYDLYWLGRLNEAIEIYNQLIVDCYAHKRWVLYFFSQINLYYLRQIVLMMNNAFSSFKGAILLGKPTKLWDDDRIHDLQLSHMITDIPSEIKQYSFLQKLIKGNYYHEDVEKLYCDNYEMEKMISKGMFTSAGQSKDQIAKIRIIDAIQFIYGNRIAFDRFSEHRSFTKIALQQRFKSMLNQNELAAASPWGTNDKNGYIDFQEVLLLIRTFNYDDLSVFYENENGSQLVLDKESTIVFEQYIQDLMLYFKDYFLKSIDADTFVQYFSLKDEMKNALFMASYYVKKEVLIYECVKYLIENAPCQEISFEKRIMVLNRFHEHMSDKTPIRTLMELDLMRRIKRCNEGTDKVIEFEKNDIVIESEAIKNLFPKFKSMKLKELIEKSRYTVTETFFPVLNGII